MRARAGKGRAVTNTDRLLAYGRRVQPHLSADPWAFYARVERGLALLKTPFPWQKEPRPAAVPAPSPALAGGGNVVAMRRRGRRG